MITNPVQPAGNTLKYLQIVFFASIILYVGKTLFIPLFFGLLIAMILYPVCKWLEQKRFPKGIAITICLLIVALLFAGIAALLIWQINMFREDAPGLIKKLQATGQEAAQWISESFGLTTANWAQQSLGSIGGLAKTVINNMLDMVFMLFLIPIYTALFLYHRRVFVQFLRWVAGERHRQKLDLMLPKMIDTYFNYIKGMILVYIIVGVLNSIGLLALGIEHAVLFGMLCAIMTIIPYVGIVVSALLPISIAWLSTDSVWYPAGVIAVFAVVQYLEANVIFPKVVGVQLNVSTWAMLVAIIAGGILWGVSGMVLFIPFVALLKIGTDYVEEWKPLNLLLGRSES
ncbi:AI-2E family transporter [Agriterribacter sp.]|uniref:AI-2E family transporter n=1 Tax=Agriterribacter sp. TaxID=2821509 RepID=UPI002BCA815D|nr:AI-2E family transporter [Agriterribacter sp.]HRO46284.1 AI-2E family transporter [Agriterribacter sp.]HRQ18525.1 AI-2E family transporter [Agriterribacter sp.]